MRLATIPVFVFAGLLLAGTVASADTVVLTPIKDNSLFEEGDLSNGAGDHLFAGVTLDPANIRRALLAFPVADSIPAGSTIKTVTLTLHMSWTATGPQDVTIHRLLADWGEGTSHALGREGMGITATTDDATWKHTFFPGSFWATEGGDFTAAASATQGVNQLDYYTWGSTPEMVADVQHWLDMPGEDFGWIVRANETMALTAKRFDSRDNTNPDVHPELTIEYDAMIQVLPSTWGHIKAIWR